MHVGATLRLLRLESGLGLRDLARRLGVSSTYLHRVENGLDPAPTAARLEQMARELGVPAPLLVELAARVSPFLVDYIDAVPDAGALFLEIADRRLDARQLAEVRAFIDQRFATRRAAAPAAARGLGELLAPERVVVGLSGATLADIFELVAGRLGGGAALAAALRAREREASSAIGGGVAVACATADGDERAALVTLAEPLPHPTPDRAPLRVVVVLAGPARLARRTRLAQVARLATRGLADEIGALRTAREVLARLAQLETFR
jgi:PTS system nitrogen regulatory IIA component